MTKSLEKQGFSIEWDQRYKENLQMSIWPWSDLVSAVMRLRLPASTRVLELGCGAGANIPFFKHLGMDYHAVEGSPVIVDQLHERFPEYKDTIKCGDFTQEIPFDGAFDLIIDRAAITHNSTKNIESVIRLIHHYLNVQGYFVGIHWFSTQHPQFGQGKKIDIFTEKYNDGPFKDLGNVHYSDKRHLLIFLRPLILNGWRII